MVGQAPAAQRARIGNAVWRRLRGEQLPVDLGEFETELRALLQLLLSGVVNRDANAEVDRAAFQSVLGRRRPSLA
jgi:hypothetical protein